MIIETRRIPDGPAERYDASQDLLEWLGGNFERYGDVFKATAYGVYLYGVNDPRYAQHVLRKNWQNYKKGFAIKRIGLLLGKGLMVSEGELWKTQRKMIQPAFHGRAIGALAQVITQANDELVRSWTEAARAGTAVNVTRDISLMVLKSVLMAIFGDDYETVAPQFRILSEEASRDLEFAQAFRPLRQLVLEVATDRRARGAAAPDMLGMLMAARDARTGQAMADGQLVSEIITLVVAGHETTASTLNWTWYLLSQAPEAEARLHAELDQITDDRSPSLADLPRFAYSRQVIEEAMRLYPAGWLMTRKALADDQLGPYFVPAGTEIYLSPYFLQRREDLWEDPHRFDPDRFAPERSRERPALAMLPFSAGPRNCIGEDFARLEMQLHLMAVARRLRLRYADGPPLALEAGVNLRSRHDFMMFPELRVAPTRPSS
ncbi:MAG: cytochrome P450 [Caulobacterales bacterium]